MEFRSFEAVKPKVDKCTGENLIFLAEFNFLHQNKSIENVVFYVFI